MTAMRIHVRPADGWPGEVVTLARRQLEFALGRFGSRVRSLTVRLSDLNGPKGGIDKRCLVTVRLNEPRRVVVVEDVDASDAAVVSRVAERVSRSVARAVHAAPARRRRA